MSDATGSRGVIELYPGRATPRRRLSLKRLLPGSVHPALSAAARLLAPAILLAAGAGLISAAGCGVARSIGLTNASVLAVAATASLWVFLATAGSSLTSRGFALARSQWTRPVSISGTT